MENSLLVPAVTCMVCLLVGLIVGNSFGRTLGRTQGRERCEEAMKKMAIRYGHARWIAGPNGECEFSWYPVCSNLHEDRWRADEEKLKKSKQELIDKNAARLAKCVESAARKALNGDANARNTEDQLSDV